MGGLQGQRHADRTRRRWLPLDTTEGKDAFYANLEGYVGMLQGQGAVVFLVLGVPSHGRFDPSAMVRRSLISSRSGCR